MIAEPDARDRTPNSADHLRLDSLRRTAANLETGHIPEEAMEQ